jgi:hypothetical protein
MYICPGTDLARSYTANPKPFLNFIFLVTLLTLPIRHVQHSKITFHTEMVKLTFRMIKMKVSFGYGRRSCRYLW